MRPPVRISIHALREEGDGSSSKGNGKACKFLSTPSARRATRHGVHPAHHPADFYPRPPRGGRLIFKGNGSVTRKISIHALREEGDRWMAVWLQSG